MAANKKINMLEGSLWDKMIVFALPLAFTGMLQQLYNAADVAVLGRFVSDVAVAAVGNNVPVIGLIISFCMGLALGVNVVVARALGMKNDRKANEAVRTSFLTAVLFGIVALFIGQLLAGPAMQWLDVPAEVRDDALMYLRVYLLGMPFIAVYNFLAAVFRSQGDTQTPLWALLAASLFNIAGNLAAVLLLNWGIAGVALATVLANLLSAIILFVRLTHLEGPLQLVPNQLFQIDSSALRSIVRIGWPAGIQGAVFSISNLVIQSAINSLGPAAMAGSVAAFTIEINVYCFINAFALAATTFVSQNFGARNLERCRRVMWTAMGLNMLATVLMTALVLVFGQNLLGIFTNNPEVIALGMIRIFWVVLPQPISVVMDTLSGCMRGYGYSMPPALVTLIVICSVRLIWVYTAFPLSPTYETLMMVYPLSWLITMIGLIVLYIRHQRMLRNRGLVVGEEF
ncbi:MAG: MATE family efflux transporter [Sutterella sp.]|nr:MATE family efflux transporter [Sutterella sp.]